MKLFYICYNINRADIIAQQQTFLKNTNKRKNKFISQL